MPFHHHKLFKKFDKKIKKIKKKVDKEIKKDVKKIKKKVDIIGKVKKKIKSRPVAYDKFIQKNSDWKLVNINICRVPIKKQIKQALNLLTSGNVDNIQEEYNYDSIFHLFGVLTFSNGEKLLIEKNEIAILKRHPKIPEKSECISRTVPDINFSNVLLDLEKDYKQFYFYSPHNHNCQKFLRAIANKMDIKDLDDFIFQFHGTKVLPKGGARKTAHTLTTTANIFQRYLLGN